MNRSSLISRRIGLLMGTFVGIVVLFVGRLFWIQIIDGTRLSEEARNRQTISQTIYGIRGSILDAQGISLAESVERYDITASPRFVADFSRDGETVTVQQALTEIATLTGADQGVMHNAISEDPNSDFTYLVKGVTIKVLREIKALNIPWVYSDLRPSRTYPRGSVAGNLVGFMGTDGPLTGVEYYLNDCLKETNGSSTYERGADGIRIPGSTIVTKPGTHGGDVKLTIDSDLQWFAQQVLATDSERLGAKWASASVVDVKDGRLIVAADWPSVDPNNFRLSESDDRGARFFTSPFEPGSVIKPFVIASLMDSGDVRKDDQFIVPREYKFSGGTISDSFPHGTLRLTSTGILVHSSNIGMNVMAQSKTKAERYNILKSWGFGSKTSVGFLGEEPGVLTEPEAVDDVTKLTEIFGQGMSSTSAQLAQAYQAIGNDGILAPLRLVDKCIRTDGSIETPESGKPRRVISETTARDIIQMMEQAAISGSVAPHVKGLGYRVAVKTGTAEVAERGEYGNERVVSVAGLVPAHDPEYAIVVTFGEPVRGKSAQYAGPAFAKIAGQTLKYYRVEPTNAKHVNLDLEW